MPNSYKKGYEPGGDDKGAAVGRPIDGYYEVDTSLLDDLFDPAYVEFVDPEGAGDPVPYREYVVTGQNEEDDLRLFSQMWFANKQSRQDDWLSPDPGRDDFDTGKENYFHLIGACKKKDGDNANGTSNWSMNAAYIWVGSIGAQPVVVRETVCHEIGHQFDVSTGRMHCTNNAYAVTPPAPQKCIKHLQQIRTNGIVRFCVSCILDGYTGPTDPGVRADPDTPGR